MSDFDYEYTIPPALYWQEKLDGSWALVLNNKEVFDCSWEFREQLQDLLQVRQSSAILQLIDRNTPSYKLEDTDPSYPYSRLFIDQLYDE